LIASILIALGALDGAAGVILLAVAAHGAPAAGLDSAGSLLLIHAAAAVAGASAIAQGLVGRALGLAAIAGLLLGSSLFGADIAMRALAGHRLFPFAAPAGGSLMIVGWLMLSVAALTRVRRR
jgi:uncharacterized membrane protein YgdD (TMEM256/DUF423 family)